MKRIAEKLIKDTNETLKSASFCETFKEKASCFTRRRKMGFPQIIGTCLNFTSKSLQLEIDNYIELTDPSIEKPITKQAFSKARQNISPDAFEHLFLMTSKTVLKSGGIKRFKGHRFFANDGLELQIPKTEETTRVFTQDRGSTSPRARASTLCDVISGYIIHANIDATTVDERTLAMEHLEYFKEFRQPKDILLFDRGYPSKDLIKYLTENKMHFIMRVQKGFNKSIDETDKPDFYVCIAGCKVRTIKLVLDNGEIEVLATDLSKNAFKHSEFKELYHLRWGIETRYNTLKNKMELETFSGKTVVSILQDFYATMYLLNLVSAIKAETDEIISADIKDKNLKYEYKTNENLLIGKLRNKLILIILNDNSKEREILLDKLVLQISSYKVPVVPGRSFKRPAASHKKITQKPKKAL